MARMIPPQYPTDTVSVAERRLFTAFEDGLDDNWTVVHSLPWLDDTARRLREGECDFLVLHPEHGMLAIEAKAGGVRYDGKRKAWFRSDGNGLNKDPFLQAQQSVHYLDQRLRKLVPGWRTAQMPFGHAVAFPDCDQLRGTFPPHVSPEIIVLQGDLDHLQRRIESILHAYRRSKSKLNGKVFGQVVDTILPEFQVVRSLSAELADQEEALFRLTTQQIRLLDAMRQMRSLLVEGCAGSGKTILALEKATRLRDDGAKVLLLCFNIPLAEALRQEVARRGRGIDVFHFGGLCEHVVSETGGAFEPDAADVSHFWDETAPELLLDSVPGFPTRYDAMVVDEAQDFCGHWWVALDSLFRDPAERVYYVFHDPSQNIFRREISLPFNDPRMVLDVNCRNTRQIADFVRQLGHSPMRSDDEAPEGTAPTVVTVSSVKDVGRELDALVRRLVQVEGLRPEQIVLLGRHRFKNALPETCGTVGGFPIVDEIMSVGQPAVRYATVYRFKGLEADCVIVLDTNEVDRSDSEDVLLYVAASRAKFLLYLLCCPEAAERAERLLNVR